MTNQVDLGQRDLDKLANVIGKPVPQLRPYESVLAVSVDLEARTACYTLQIHQVVDTVRETRIVKRGMRMFAFAYNGTDWVYAQSITVWDDAFVPVILHNVGKIETPAEWRAQRNFERDCYRPGASRAPLDNFDRSFDGLPVGDAGTDLTPAGMKKHWRL